ncbi:apolipoprotein D-like [Musca vetustissima]|uniref:apolipoprotein D-like n=1 Tax=Musca vetustissima TaxID=27455 RepID=UPI002AB6AB02|nr:apolipoprotein D-like [Musca vetustissima]
MAIVSGKTATFITMTVVIMTIQFGMGQVVSSNCCPTNVEVVSSFDVSKYLGLWYEYAKYPTYFEADGVCITAEYSLLDDGLVGVKNSQVNGTTGQPDVTLGNATVVSNAKLLVKFPVSPVYTVSSNYWVLDTDYTTYSVVYSCQELPNSQSSTIVWILTRERLPSEKTIETALAVLKKNGISLDPLTITNQVACC